MKNKIMTRYRSLTDELKKMSEDYISSAEEDKLNIDYIAHKLIHDSFSDESNRRTFKLIYEEHKISL